MLDLLPAIHALLYALRRAEGLRAISDWNPASVEDAIYKASQRISAGVTKCDTAYRDFLKADHAFDLAEAKAYLRARGAGSPAHCCEHEATIATETERADRDVKEATYRLMDKNMKALMAELDALRSIGTSVRQAYAQGQASGGF